ncbi:MAG: hypothetical protein NWQ25_09705 [Prochlorococcaceae cyanobacterium MAG_34]|nr:hypothetical protein [Prochlorococcaceae cyanobacterium MAG_34]
MEHSFQGEFAIEDIINNIEDEIDSAIKVQAYAAYADGALGLERKTVGRTRSATKIGTSLL